MRQNQSSASKKNKILLSVQIRDLLDLTLSSPTDNISIDQKEIEMITRHAGIAMALAARSSAI
jgi:hypothetical protein